ncbi:MAG: type 1 glutamine amidotransferase domain-containing protein [Psychroserpens sp.]|uniref:type 1 glutamine amidotransferase domain-containing protein n=1 Tax=Psychroserpens sp. TaxID=2020870 RepID=UPI003001D092
MKHILFIVTSTNVTGTGKHAAGYEFSEVADPYFEFANKGYNVDFASIQGDAPPFVGYDNTQILSKNFKEGNGFKRLNFSHKLSDVDIDAYDAIFFPGGLGPMTDMVTNPLVKDIIKTVYESGRVVGAVCHGPVALLNVTLSNGENLLEGKRINSFTEAEENIDKHILGDVIPFMLDAELIKQGGQFSYTTPFDPFIVADGNLVTGQNPASASGVAIEMMALMHNNIETAS